jgi:hypothetical protein
MDTKKYKNLLKSFRYKLTNFIVVHPIRLVILKNFVVWGEVYIQHVIDVVCLVKSRHAWCR